MDKRMMWNLVYVMFGCIIIGFLLHSLATPKTPEPLGRMHDAEPVFNFDKMAGTTFTIYTNNTLKRTWEEIIFKATTDGMTNSSNGHDYWVMEVWVHKRDCKGSH